MQGGPKVTLTFNNEITYLSLIIIFIFLKLNVHILKAF